jgi:hypothetical protein
VLVSLGQTGVVPTIGEVDGAVITLTLNVTGVAEPQLVFCVQVKVPEVVPQLTVTTFVPCPAVIVPLPEIVQLNVEPGTFDTE